MAATPCLVITPQLVALVSYLIKEASQPGGWKIPDDDTATDVVFADLSCATKFGEMLGHTESGIVVLGLQVLRTEETQFRKLESVCCGKCHDHTLLNISPHKVEKKEDVLDWLAKLHTNVEFNELDEDDQEELKHCFDEMYICLSDVLEEVLASVQ